MSDYLFEALTTKPVNVQDCSGRKFSPRPLYMSYLILASQISNYYQNNK